MKTLLTLKRASFYLIFFFFFNIQLEKQNQFLKNLSFKVDFILSVQPLICKLSHATEVIREASL